MVFGEAREKIDLRSNRAGWGLEIGNVLGSHLGNWRDTRARQASPLQLGTI
jgi:hypothetical protein